MNEFQRAKEVYDNILIPAQLPERVRAGIQEGRARCQARRSRTVRRALAAAACFVLLVAGLNLSPTLAKAAADVPVLGRLFRVFTVTSYNASDGGINYMMSVPRLEADGTAAEKVNAAIQEKVDAHLEKARQDWAEYQEAFFATGGTEEEWGGREMDVFVEYEVKSETDTQVSFVVTLAEGWVTSMEERYYYNLDLSQDRDLTLRDLLGEDWAALCNAAIQRRIEESAAREEGSLFFPAGEGGFTTVDETTGFYVREDGVVVVCFPRYAIAAGAAGIPEFPIE